MQEYKDTKKNIVRMLRSIRKLYDIPRKIAATGIGQKSKVIKKLEKEFPVDPSYVFQLIWFYEKSVDFLSIDNNLGSAIKNIVYFIKKDLRIIGYEYPEKD